jgi:hypothetical protein
VAGLGDGGGRLMLEVEGRCDERRWCVMIVSDTRDTGRALRR